MTEKLTYEQFCEQVMLTVSDQVIADLQQYHDIDGRAEIEKIRRQEYNDYLVCFLPGT